MKIKSWSFENYKSFGGTKQNININQDEGELILVTGKNGSGKTSFFETLDVSLFGTTLNKRGTKLSKKSYPNWNNNNMKVSCQVETQGRILDIERTMKNDTSTMKTKVSINNTEKTPAKVDEFIETELNTDFSTFKSFCSINVSYFKNFISLTPEDKRVILDKIFNMQQVNELNKIFKQLKEENIKSEISINSKIKAYKENIEDLKISIVEFLENQKKNSDNEEKIKEIEKNIKDLKKQIKIKEKEQLDIENTLEQYDNAINDLRLKIQNHKRDLSDINEKIDLYSLGKCPTCSHDLTEELDLLPGLNEQKEKINKLVKKLSDKINIGNEEITEYKKIVRTLRTTLQELNNSISSYETKKTTLETKEDIDISSFENMLDKENNKLKGAEEEYIEVEKMKYIYEVLSPIWTNDGIKKQIIDSIIEPINQFIKEDLERVEFPYTVELDDKFDAHIYRLMNEIDVDAISSGETRKINLIIMLAYIKMMRMNNDLNLLILDEVFTTIDLEGIDEVLHILKEFAKERLITIFVVHHTELKEYFFDRIFNITKPYYSIIEEK